MYRIIYYSCLLVLLPFYSAFSSPAFSVSDPGIWGEGVLTYDSMISPVFSVIVQDQRNSFPEQINRFVGVKPDDSSQQERHYEKRRSSRLEYTSLEAMGGIKIWDRFLLYGLFGRAYINTEFNYSDTTITAPGGTLSVKENFDPDECMIWGGGVSGIIYDQTFKDFVERVKFGLDFRYRHIGFRTDWENQHTKFYKTSLDEYQLALMSGCTIGYFSPFFGFRVSNMVGSETYALDRYKISENYEITTAYNHSISTIKNIGWIYGVSASILDSGSITFEARTGDEDAYGVSVSMKF